MQFINEIKMKNKHNVQAEDAHLFAGFPDPK